MAKPQKNKPTVAPAVAPVKPQAAPKRTPVQDAPAKAAMPLIRQLTILLSIVAFAVYANTLVNGYALDDEIVVKNNTMVNQGFAGIGELLATPHMRGYMVIPNDTYRPLSLVTYAIERGLFGANTTMNHLVNVLFFVGCVIAFFFFVHRLLGKKALPVAFAAALLFAVHPLHTEVVANIKSRDELMCFFFAFAALNRFMAFMDDGKMKDLVFGAVILFLSFISKETVIAFVAIVPLLFFFFYNADNKRAVGIAIATLLPAIAFILVRYMVLSAYQANVSGDIEFIDNALTRAPNFIARFATAIVIMGNYLKQMFVPYPLICNYSYNSIPYASLASPGFWLSLAAYGVMAFYAVKALMKKQKDLMAFAVLFFLCSLALFSNIFMLIGAEMAERFTFFATAGFCIAAAIAIKKWLIRDMPMDIALLKKGKVALVLIPVCLLFASITVARNMDWKDNFSLYNADIEKSPDDCRLNYYMGTALAEEKYESEKDAAAKTTIDNESIQFLRKSIGIYSGFTEANVEMGRVYDREHKYDSAEYYDKKALAIFPGHPLCNNNLGSVYLATGRYRDAINCYMKTLSLKPDFYLACFNAARTYEQLHIWDSSIYFFNKTLQLNPNYFDVYSELGLAYFNKGDYEHAEQIFKKQLQLTPDDANAVNNLGATYLNSKKYDMAIPQFAKSIQLNPKNINAYSNLGRAYYFAGQYAQAIDIFSKELNLDPRSGRDVPYMALSYQKLGQKENALKFEAIAKHFYSDFKLP